MAQKRKKGSAAAKPATKKGKPAAKRARIKIKTAVRGCVLAASEETRFEVGGERLDQLAMAWSYIVRNRHRWAEAKSEVDRLSGKATQDLQKLGIGDEQLRKLASCPVVEVQIDYESEEESWPARIFPWEFVLSRATRHLPDRHPDFLVVRHLKRSVSAQRKSRPRSLLSVGSAPGAFSHAYDFSDEHALLADGFSAKKGAFKRLDNPTVSELQRSAVDFSAVHLSGIDAQLGDELLERTSKRGPSQGKTVARDGLYLMSEGGRGAELVDAQRLAKALTSEGGAPDLVTFNVYGSAARMASLCVANGAGAALGFQDRFDDAQAERFFAELYRDWASGRRLVDCFRAAFRAMKEQKDVRLGSGVVLWSSTSVLTAEKPARTSVPAPRARTAAEVRSYLKVRVERPETLNYPKLHNGENLFKRLIIYNHSNQKVSDVQVEVELRVGAESYSYHHRFDLEHSVVSLEDKVRLALSWSMMRELTESVRTTILVRALHEGHIFHEDTYSVELLPANEWVDDEESGPWLPSLVLPRDPVVPEIIDRARRYLRVLADDAHVGFDGYQQVEMTEDQELDEEQAFIVDIQVRAIWYALLHDYGLGYINPPPTFTAESQRLRRPSEVVRGRHGTCIDLALLLAACLEYVGIHPVLFLIDGHAFPGYWRMETTLEHVHVAGNLDRAVAESVQSVTKPWSSGREYWSELKTRIGKGHIVPIETVDLTALESFDVAVEHGQENLKRKSEFHTMLDVVKARQHRVTPLPL